MLVGDPATSAGKALPPQQTGESNAVRNDEVIVPISPPTIPSNITESRKNFLKYGVPLYQAAMDGDWETANTIFNEAPDWILLPITKRNDTVLHIATAAKNLEFVTKLVDLMVNSKNDRLESRTTVGNTAFCIAASSGNVEIAKVMVSKNRQLPNIKGSTNLTPLHMAILLGHKAMVNYLIGVTDDTLLKDEERIELLTSAIKAHLYDTALHFIEKNPHLAVHRNMKHETVLHTLASKHLQHHASRRSMWKNFLRKCTNVNKDEKQQQLEFALQVTQRAWDEVIKQDEKKISKLIGEPWRLLFVAAEAGNVDFLTTLIRSYPDLIWKVDDKSRTIFHVAVECRHEEIFKLIHEIGAVKDLIATYKDEEQNNMLHLAAKIARPHRLNCVSGAALQLQRELLWFEAVKEVVQPHYAVEKNRMKISKGDSFVVVKKTPKALFTEEHEHLRLQGEEWMKKTAESCTIVATLITTVIFTAAFTLPGGNDEKDGSPILLKQASFKVFAISNAVSLFSSSTSILMFLSILISRYAEKDFLKVLPFKLMVGLTSLFVSIATMMVAFTATFFITFQKDSIWIPAPIALLAVIPVLLFAFMQYPLLKDIHSSTYGSKNLFQPSHKRKLSWTSKISKAKLS